MSKNDTTVISLKAQLKEKKANIKKNKFTAPVTNCSLSLFNQRYNIHTLALGELVFLLTMLTTLKKEAETLNIVDSFSISGYNICDWVFDLQNKVNEKKSKQELEALNAIENRLDNLLSDDKKVEIELDSIAQLLK